MDLNWLHISDFHVRGGDPYDREVVLQALVRAVADYRKQGRVPEVVFATGDIAFSGKPDQYEIAGQFFNELLAAAQLDKSRLFVIPGNHDVDRDLGIGLARTLGDEADTYFAPKTPKPHLTQKMGGFLEWHGRYFEGKRAWPKDSTCGPVMALGKLGILTINSALFCQGDDDHAKLWVGRRCLSAAIAELQKLGTEVNVALIHHPLDWLHDLERSNIKSMLHSGVQVILRGHLHETEIESVVSATGQALHCAAGAAYQTRRWPNRALYGRLSGDSLAVFPIRYEDAPSEVWTTDASVFPREPGHERRFAFPRTDTPTVPKREPQPLPMGKSNVPPLRWALVGRDPLLAEVKAQLRDALVLHGPAGVGKTEVAREFGRRERQHYPGGTFFVDGSQNAIAIELARLGKTILQIDFPPDLSLEDQALRVLYSLGAGLLIYDNVTSEAAITPWLPPAGSACHALITTTNDDWSPGWLRMEVKPLPYQDSVELIRKLAGDEVARKFGGRLAEISEGLPVQICPQAAALGYEARHGRLDSAQVTLAAEAKESFRGVFDRLEADPQLLAQSAAFLNTQGIPKLELLRHLKDGAGWTEARFEDALDACVDLHVLQGAETLRMHRLFASFCSSAPGKEGGDLPKIRAAQAQRVLELAGKVFRNPVDAESVGLLLVFPVDPEAWEGIGRSLSVDEGQSLANALYQIGRFQEALPWYRIAVASREEADQKGPVDHVPLAYSLHQVGYCLSNLGRYGEARPWYERATEEYQKGDIGGRVERIEFAKSLYQVGICLSSVGQYTEAQVWYERAVAEHQKGDLEGRVNHTGLSASLYQVGICLSSVGQYAEARPWYERAAEKHQEGDVHGRVNHTELSKSLHQVGICLSSLGQYLEARRWYQRAVDEGEKGDIHGRVDHTSQATSMYQLGICFSGVGQYAEARPWYERAAEEHQKGDIHGRVNHTEVAKSLHQAGICRSNPGQYAEARPWYERAAEEYRKGDIHGRVNHTELAKSLHLVGYCLSKSERHAEARPWFERAVVEHEKGDVLGRVNYKELAKALGWVAFCLRKEGLPDQAAEWEKRDGEAQRQADKEKVSKGATG